MNSSVAMLTHNTGSGSSYTALGPGKHRKESLRNGGERDDSGSAVQGSGLIELLSEDRQLIPRWMYRNVSGVSRPPGISIKNSR